MATPEELEEIRKRVRAEVEAEYREEKEWLLKIRAFQEEAKNATLGVEIAEKILQEKRILEWNALGREEEWLEEYKWFKEVLGEEGYQVNLQAVKEEVRKTRLAREASEFLLQEAIRKNIEALCKSNEEWRKFTEARALSFRKFEEAGVKADSVEVKEESMVRVDVRQEKFSTEETQDEKAVSEEVGLVELIHDKREESVKVNLVQEGVSTEATLGEKQEVRVELVSEEVATENEERATGEFADVDDVSGEDVVACKAQDEQGAHVDRVVLKAKGVMHTNFKRGIMGDVPIRGSGYDTIACSSAKSLRIRKGKAGKSVIDSMIKCNWKRRRKEASQEFNNLNWKKRRKAKKDARQQRGSVPGDSKLYFNWKKRRKEA